MAVHDVDVDEIGAAALHLRDGLAKRREVGSEDGRSDLNLHLLTSIEIGSPGAIWNPPCGLCRSTMPAATPG